MATPPDAPPSSPGGKPPNPDTKAEAVKESSPTSAFVNSEPIREEQVQNAVKFLSHPKVRGSPVIYRRSFLERKGLTKEEIDEAFRRVPDSTPAVTTTQPVVTNQDGQIKSLSNVQQQPPAQAVPTPVGPVSTVSKMGAFSRFHWYQAVLAVSFLAASGAGTAVLFKNAIVPRLKSWIRKVVLEQEDEGLLKKNNAKPSIVEEAAAAAKAAATASTDVARASQEMLITKTEEKRYMEELVKMLSVQVQEMKSMSNAIQKLESGQSTNGRLAVEEQYNQRVSGSSSRQPYANGKPDTDSRSVRSLSPPISVEPSVAPHPKSYNEILDMIQRGERPPNIREIDDSPPNPNQPVSNPRLAPKPKPWEVTQPQNTFANTFPTQDRNNASFYDFPDNQLNGDNGAPWLRGKNVRITEVESSDEQKFGPTNLLGNDRPVQRSWVPPQPPPVVMPEAAAAIRQPKKASNQTEQMTDDQLLARSASVTDELQRITKISESGGPVEANGESSVVHLNEIAKEDNGSYLET
ncbi:Peroxisomal membrane anchor protein (peroxin) [Handroanthus impetiginosus]|uniref:Peroxisomal membrane protein PEX14 n=1 Tax=Handroanthus impetiginosus TaxID=429701 RepID=A0A2G9HDD8_9LAMI|nr:Peroxisomal membrane anchor protein (peroxin) [Handroanthus impetiginosus]